MLVQYITKGRRGANRPISIEESGTWGQKKGVMIGYIHIDEETGKPFIYIGFSLKNKKEWDWGLYFDKSEALRKATGKAYSLSSIVVVPEGSIKYTGQENLRVKNAVGEIPHSIRRDMFKFIDRCKRYFKDAELAPFWKRVDSILQENSLSNH